MSKYIDADKLKMLVGELKEHAQRNCCDTWGIVPDALEEVEGFIASLQQEQPEIGLEKEVIDYFEGYWPGMETAEQCNTQMHFTPPAIMRLVRHFYELGLNARNDE